MVTNLGTCVSWTDLGFSLLGKERTLPKKNHGSCRIKIRVWILYIVYSLVRRDDISPAFNVQTVGSDRRFMKSFSCILHKLYRFQTHSVYFQCTVGYPVTLGLLSLQRQTPGDFHYFYVLNYIDSAAIVKTQRIKWVVRCIVAFLYYKRFLLR